MTDGLERYEASIDKELARILYSDSRCHSCNGSGQADAFNLATNTTRRVACIACEGWGRAP